MLSSVQCLRGVAALLVVLFHVVMFSNVEHVERGGLVNIGNSGVDIFFIISGFVMWVSTCNSRKAPLEFWRDRIVRIVPLYYLATTIFIAALYIFKGNIVTTWDLFISYFFIPGVNSINKEPVPILGVGWTLNYEMMFYFVFGLALLVPRRLRIAFVATIFFALVVGRFILPADAGVLLRITSPLWLEFLAGMLIGVLFISGSLGLVKPAGWVFGGAAMMFGVGVLIGLHLVAPGLPRTLAYGIPAACLVLGAILMEPLFRHRALWPLRWLGDISYSLYLAHGIWIFVLRSVNLPLTGLALFVVALVGAVIAGGAAYYLVERPITEILRRAARGELRKQSITVGG